MRAALRWTWIPVVLALLYSGWVLWSRRAANAEIEARAQQEAARKDQEILQKLGGSDLKILMFYANPPTLAKGQEGLLCYGVSNAASVRIEPEVSGVGPALNRCVRIRPTRSASYTLWALDGKGKELSQTVEVRVR